MHLTFQYCALALCILAGYALYTDVFYSFNAVTITVWLFVKDVLHCVYI